MRELEELDFILGSTLIELPGHVIHVSLFYDHRSLKTWPRTESGDHQGCLFSRVRKKIEDAGWKPVLCGDERMRFEWMVNP